MNLYVKSLDRERKCFEYICKSFPWLSTKKLIAEVFDGPDIRKLIKDNEIADLMNGLELCSWTSFVDCNLSDIPPSQNLAQGHFMVWATHEFRHMHDRCKSFWHHQHSHFGTPQAPSYKLSPASRQWPEGTAHWSQSDLVSKQLPSMNARWRPEGMIADIIRWHGEKNFLAITWPKTRRR